MPELAEVELIRRQLAGIVGRTITTVESLDRKLVDLDAASGHEVTSLLRHGKLLGLQLTDNIVLACHLRMTGALTFSHGAHARAVIRFGDGQQLWFTDPRRFGTLRVETALDFGKGLGPDLLNDSSLLPATHARAARRRSAVKTVLLDQSLVAGIGNYMADEALWRARTHPQSQAASLSDEEWMSVLTHAQMIAVESIAHGGVSIRDYKHVDGTSGRMQERLLCYGRGGLACARCEGVLQKLRVGGRGTTYCPFCQSPPAG